MKINFQPRDIGIWLDIIDVNRLSDAEADRLDGYDVNDDNGLVKFIVEWIKPRFEEENAQNRSEMTALLDLSKQWTADQLRPVFEGISVPSGQKIYDINRFMDILRRQILD